MAISNNQYITMKNNANIQVTTTVKYRVFDYMYREDFDTLKEARAEYRAAKSAYGQAEIIKNRVKVITITESSVIQSC